MSIESNKAAVRQFRAALDAGDLDAAMTVYAPNVVVHVSGTPEPLTLEGFKHVGGLLLGAFSDGRSTVEDLIAEGDKVVSRLTFRGTHTGDLMGIPPTGRAVTVSEVIVDRFVDGKIVESWRLFEQMTMLQQLGVIPAPAQGGSQVSDGAVRGASGGG